MLKIYTAGWCNPCKMIKQLLDKEEIEYKEINIDSEEGSEIARGKGIRGIPTLEIDNRFLIGANSLKQIQDFISS